MLTFMKPGKYAVSMNARHYQPLPKWINPFPARVPSPLTLLITRIGNLYAYMFYKVEPIFWTLRKVAEQAETYDEAVKMLSTTNHVAPSYLIVSGIEKN